MSGRLPSGWAIATLPELASTDGLFADGDWVESKDQDPGGHVRLIQLTDIGDGYYRNRSDRFLTAVKAKERGCTFLRPGDILISRLADPLGRACIFPGDNKPSVTVVDVAIFRASAGQAINHTWLKNWINAEQFRRRIEEQASGTTRKRISRSNLGRVNLPLPPLNEQKRIVAKIEALQARSDAAKQALNAIPPLLEKFRQSVLAAACKGKLTNNTTIDRLPPHWRMARIGDLAVPGGIFDGARDHGTQTAAAQNLRTVDYTTSGVRVVRLENLGHLRFIENKHTFISEEKFQGLK